jgi:hypothetical protein
MIMPKGIGYGSKKVEEMRQAKGTKPTKKVKKG